ncbi:Formate-tetrahydrofolate ligase [Austwickia chelonae]|uniref:Formate--tetrahydrofolate ligase n=1 Tax=Austwickia chelonae NBRC 105200 TaxID=1184607 RepID=K6ULG6_9MICO|nr:formate--tetrahydrofolate ligase [Austwickia chelonae]GAB77231.1 formate--tetrahydrofolate ligase [Austwickia chelonae NBRC 105200]SEW05686.1 Formate-tetrahydrofolate ligase [Austwickia chelonae]
MSTSLPSDLEIARRTVLAPLGQIALDAGIAADHLEPYGHAVAKIADTALSAMSERPRAKYIVVTAITPTPLGEGKTTTAVGLAQGFKHLGKQATLALRQPSMGPTFGIKGGAAGAGYSQVVPMETLNLHLTGDFHAITAAHNMLSAMLDNHLHHGNELGIDPRRISWRRVVDINDRSLRNVVLGLGARIDGVPRQSGFDITAASEVGVALALATSLQDLRRRLGRIVVGYTFDGAPVTAEDLKAAGAMTVIMRDAVKPNLMQTIEHTPVLIHAGPFGNIATGNSSIIADLVGIRMGDYLITEAGFGSDMGAERFFNVKCRESGLQPDAAVLVVTVRALKTHSGRYKVTAGKPLPAAMLEENPDDVRAGADNLRKHLQILSGFGISPVVAINVFPDDHESEHEVIREIARESNARVATSTHVVDGGAGAVALAEAVAAACDEPHDFRYSYELDMPLKDKLTAVATKVYGADHVAYAPEAEKNLAEFERLGYGGMPVVMAKTHLSISHDPALRGAPTGWTLPVREVRLAAGAGYVYAICGEMRTMPGLSKSPAAERIDIDADGQIVGLF